MLTSKPISTVWYGSKEFLEYQLKQLILHNKLIFYAFINHLKEEDEKKDHIHVYIVPDGRLDTSSLTDILTEIDVNNPLPIKPLPYRKSKFDDWYLYNSHNTVYLASKGQERKYHYSKEDFVTSNDDYFTELIHQMDMSKVNRLEIVKEAAERGESYQSIVAKGMIPIPLINQYQKAFMMFQSAIEQTYRNNRQTHEYDEQHTPIQDLGDNKNITEKRLNEFFGNNWRYKEDEEQK